MIQKKMIQLHLTKNNCSTLHKARVLPHTGPYKNAVFACAILVTRYLFLFLCEVVLLYFKLRPMKTCILKSVCLGFLGVVAALSLTALLMNHWFDYTSPPDSRPVGEIEHGAFGGLWNKCDRLGPVRICYSWSDVHIPNHEGASAPSIFFVKIFSFRTFFLHTSFIQISKFLQK